MEIRELSRHLQLLEEGIYTVKNRPPVSYPPEANALFLKIEENSFWFKHRSNIIKEVVKGYPPGGAIFDIGGGNGFVSRGLREAGFETVLVEPGLEGARNARERGLSPVICAALEEARFQDKALPSAGLFDVIEHVQEDNSFLREVYRVLKVSGRLYITVPAYPVLWSGEDDWAGHYRRYTLETLSEKLLSAGFRPEYTTYFFSIFPLPVFFFRALPGRLGIRKKGGSKINIREHRPLPGAAGLLLDKCFQWEIKRVRQGRRMAAGSSCLAVAVKE